jgi:hypothetical protein
VGQLTGQLNAATVALENLTEDAAALKAEKEALEATHATVVRVSPRVHCRLHRRCIGGGVCCGPTKSLTLGVHTTLRVCDIGPVQGG